MRYDVTLRLINQAAVAAAVAFISIFCDSWPPVRLSHCRVPEAPVASVIQDVNSGSSEPVASGDIRERTYCVDLPICVIFNHLAAMTRGRVLAIAQRSVPS